MSLYPSPHYPQTPLTAVVGLCWSTYNYRPTVRPIHVICHKVCKPLAGLLVALAISPSSERAMPCEKRRKNWPFLLEQATGLAFRFVIGRSRDAKKMANLTQEVDKYKDFMRIDVEEDHASSPYKTLAFFKAAFELLKQIIMSKSAMTYIYAQVYRLATLLAKERTNSMTYIGCMKKGPVVTDPKMKW
ncbi:putative beta-1 3-galactosyltransferase 12 [Bienertia sinuspersici]